MKFRKKPVVIEAVQVLHVDVTGARLLDKFPLAENPTWIEAAIVSGAITLSNSGARDYEVLLIHTLEGDMEAMPGDWIIRGVKGELYPCKPDIFEATYDPAGETE